MSNFRFDPKKKARWEKAAKRQKFESLTAFLTAAADAFAANGSGPAVPSQPSSTSQRKTRAAAPTRRTTGRAAVPRPRSESRAATTDKGASGGARSARGGKRTYKSDFKASKDKK